MKPKQNREKELETMLTLSVAMVVFFLVGKQHHKAFLAASIIIGLTGLFSNYLTTKISWAWLKFGEILGNINSKIILTLVFYLILFPVAIISRLFGKGNTLQLKKSPGDSYYFTRNHKFESKDLENIW